MEAEEVAGGARGGGDGGGGLGGAHDGPQSEQSVPGLQKGQKGDGIVAQGPDVQGTEPSLQTPACSA